MIYDNSKYFKFEVIFKKQNQEVCSEGYTEYHYDTTKKSMDTNIYY